MASIISPRGVTLTASHEHPPLSVFVAHSEIAQAAPNTEQIGGVTLYRNGSEWVLDAAWMEVYRAECKRLGVI